MVGVAEGLSYLHSNDVVHGDLKGVRHIDQAVFDGLTDISQENILFDSTGVARIADFGISSITFDPKSNNASTAWRGYSLRWAAPEILTAPLQSELRRPTKMADAYAFGMVVMEVGAGLVDVSTDLASYNLCQIFTGKFPFPDDTDMNVHLMVMKGKRPSKPADASKLGLSSTAWKLVEECWNKKRDKRPEMEYVVARLRKSW